MQIRDAIKNNQFKITILASILLLPIILMLASTQEVLRYQAWPILDNEYWRWLTGHWVHLSWGHLWMNWLAMLVLVLSFFENHSAKSWLALCVLLSLLTSVAFILFSPELRWYVGMSGILHGFFVFLIMQDHKLPWLYKALFLLALAAKLIWEQLYGPMPGSAALAGGNVVVDAHLFGAIAGSGVVLTVYIAKKISKAAES